MCETSHRAKKLPKDYRYYRSNSHAWAERPKFTELANPTQLNPAQPCPAPAISTLLRVPLENRKEAHRSKSLVWQYPLAKQRTINPNKNETRSTPRASPRDRCSGSTGSLGPRLPCGRRHSHIKLVMVRPWITLRMSTLYRMSKEPSISATECVCSATLQQRAPFVAPLSVCVRWGVSASAVI